MVSSQQSSRVNSKDNFGFTQDDLFSLGEKRECIAGEICGESSCLSCIGSYKMDSKGYGVVSPSHPEILGMFADIGGLNLLTIQAKSQRIPKLPSFIPQLKRGCYRHWENKLDRNFKWVGISLKDALDSASNCSAKRFREKWRLGKAKLIITAYGFDDLLEENIWKRFSEKSRVLIRIKPDLITGINFSIFDSHPPFEHLFNMKRGFKTFKYFQDYGLSSIPHIYWYNDFDLVRLAEWLNKNRCITTVARNMQTLKSFNSFKKTLDELVWLNSQITREIHFVLSGTCVLERLKLLGESRLSLTLISGWASHLSYAKKSVSFNGSDFKVEDGQKKPCKDRFFDNNKAFESGFKSSAPSSH